MSILTRPYLQVLLQIFEDIYMHMWMCEYSLFGPLKDWPHTWSQCRVRFL
jgi:hypothetical protein